MGEIVDQSKTTTITGMYKSKKTGDGKMEIVIELKKKPKGASAKGKITVVVESGSKPSTVTISSNGLKSVSNPEQSDKSKIKAIITDNNGGKMTIVINSKDGTHISSEGTVSFEQPASGIFEVRKTSLALNVICCTFFLICCTCQKPV